jgi:hypothetical protein
MSLIPGEHYARIVLNDQSLAWTYARELPEDFCIKPFHAFEPGEVEPRGSRPPGEGRRM